MTRRETSQLDRELGKYLEPMVEGLLSLTPSWHRDERFFP